MGSHDLNGIDNRISVRGYFERVMKEQQEALRVAEVEREKSAANVRRALEENMKAGDERLQDHITHQIESVRSALTAMRLLLDEKEGRLADRFASQDMASAIALRNAEEGIKVAKVEAKARLDDHNGILDKMEKLVLTFPNRKEMQVLAEKIDTKLLGSDEKISALQKWQAKLGGGILVVAFIVSANFVKVWIG